MYRIKISRGRTIHLGNYESASFEVSLEEDFEDYTPRDRAYNQVSEDVQKMLLAEEDRAKGCLATYRTG